MNITEELLKNNGFVPMNIGIPYYQKSIKGFALDLWKDEEGLNSGREWSCHIDNEDYMSIGCVEIDTTEQLQLVCQIYEIDYKQVISE